MRIEFSGASVEIEEYQTEDFMRCAEAAFVAAGYSRVTFAEMVEQWVEEYRMEGKEA